MLLNSVNEVCLITRPAAGSAGSALAPWRVVNRSPRTYHSPQSDNSRPCWGVPCRSGLLFSPINQPRCFSHTSVSCDGSLPSRRPFLGEGAWMQSRGRVGRSRENCLAESCPLSGIPVSPRTSRSVAALLAAPAPKQRPSAIKQENKTL